MLIDAEKCVISGECVKYCPTNAISLSKKTAIINLKKCVECGNCKRVNICPRDAIFQQDLKGNRVLRASFSNPNYSHKGMSTSFGRGTSEVKTNDITGRYKRGFAGVILEMGRPGVGTTLEKWEK
jgi:Fe-S-cluster-containing hydrogenase component 2